MYLTTVGINVHIWFNYEEGLIAKAPTTTAVLALVC